MKLVGKYIPYDENDKLKGIFNFYNHVLQRQQFEIYTKTHSSHTSIDPIEITKRDNQKFIYWCSAIDYPNITFHFEYPILVTSYSIENARPDFESHSYPKEWLVSGSNDNFTWNEIDKQKDINFCNSKNGVCTKTAVFSFTIKYPEYYSYIRFTNIKNSVSDDIKYFLLSSLELFGEIQYKFIPTCEYINIKGPFTCYILIIIFI